MTINSNILGVENSISVIRGESRVFQLYVENVPSLDSDSEKGPVNLTGSRIIFTVKTCPSAMDVVFRKDSNNGSAEVMYTAPKAGLAEIYIAPDDTKTLETGSYVFDIWLLLADGSRYCIVGPADFIVEPGVTVFI
jgi:hypothetical protein